MRRKYDQVKAYSKIIKYKRGTQQGEEVQLPNSGLMKEEKLEQEKPFVVDVPKNQDFQDPFEDQFQQEEGWISASDGEEEEVNESGTMTEDKQAKNQKDKNAVYLGNNKNLNKGQVLEFDNRAYDMLHRLNVEWPSMSIDFIAKSSPFDTLLAPYQQMNKYPYQVMTIQGSCNNSNKNSLYFTKWTKLHQTKFDDDPEGGNENEDENDDQDPQIIVQEMETTHDVNRIKSLNYSPIVAFWSDDGHRGDIHIVDLSDKLQKLNNNIASKKRQKCKQIIIPCQSSGYAINWNPHKIGQLIAGDNKGIVSVYNNNQNYTQWHNTSQYSYHKGSVQDIIFSPQQSFVFASCSSDGTLQIVDMRVNNYKKSQLKIKAHSKDVNVCDWNKVATHLIVTGSDDCKVKVWDLRRTSQGSQEELLCFNWHTEPITSIKFQPNQQSVIAVASEDNRLTIWDMSVENQQEQPQIPNQLMFLHQGQQEIKEISFHPVYYEMIISTSLDSINIFKPSFEMPEFGQDELIDEQDLKKPPIREEDLDKYIEQMDVQ